jgi:hypothetical protein
MKRIAIWLPLLALCALPVAAQQYTTGQAARLVIGQKPFTEQDPTSSDKILGSVAGVAYGGNTLLVADSNRVGAFPVNNRVLIYNNVSSFIYDPKAEVPQSDKRCPACVGKADLVIGQEAFDKVDLLSPSQSTVRAPIGVAYNGRYVAVADTGNNRVLVWRSLPTANKQNADFVVGQPDFTATKPNRGRNGLRAPQGVWLDAQDGLWVADTQNNRVLYYGVITKNNQDATLVLGQPNFDTDQQPDITKAPTVRANTMLSPMSVMTDGTRLFVADLGISRVLIWNSIPTSNEANADVVIGQPDMASFGANRYRDKLCESTGKDEDGNALYPQLCAATLSLPRFALSDGQRLYISDSGNDRVLVYNTIPTTNAASADVVLGQQSLTLNQASDSAEPLRVSATDSFRTPHQLAWDGQNLYVADVFNRRVLVYTAADYGLPLTAVRNLASPDVFAVGSLAFGGTVTKDDEVEIKIGNETVENSTKSYKYKAVENDTITDVIEGLVALINAGEGDPYVIATPNFTVNAIILTARNAGTFGNDVTVEYAQTPATTKITVTSSGSSLVGGQDAALVGPFALVQILGSNLADQTIPSQPLDQPQPTELGGVQVYCDGLRMPVIAVSPDRIVSQLPVESSGSNSATCFIRTLRNDGRLTISNPVAVPVIAQNPGVFNAAGIDPSPGLVYHFSSQATGTASVDGTIKENDISIITIRDREYRYQIKKDDTKEIVRDALIKLINESDPEVEAFPSGTFTRVRLRARVPGPEGNNIPIGAKAVRPDGSADVSIIMSVTNTRLCCSNEAGALVTPDNPAQPGETIVVLATGLGTVKPEAARNAMINGQPYNGPEINDVEEFVASLAGGKTANVLFAGLRRGLVGIYEVHLELNSDIPTNPKTQVTIAQSFQVSNIFSIPVVNPNPTN